MNTRQLLMFAAHGLWRQKVRTLLTLAGVAVGTCALAFSVALGLGMRAFIDTEFKGRDDFWRVLVYVDEPPPDEARMTEKDRERVEVKGAMPGERKARLREALIDVHLATGVRKPLKPLTADVLAGIADLPDVAEVRVFRSGKGWLTAAGTNGRPGANAVSGPLDDLRPRLLVGRLPASPDSQEVVLSELALYQLDQFGVRDDSQLEQVLGKEVTLEIGGTNDERALAGALLGKRLPEPTATQVTALKKVRANFLPALGAFGLTAEERADLLKLLAASAEASDDGAAFSGEKESRTYRVCGVARVLTREERKKATPLDSWELQRGIL